jgi:hypothetical protein
MLAARRELSQELATDFGDAPKIPLLQHFGDAALQHRDALMANWLASQLCVLAAFGYGSWRTFKTLKRGEVDFALLKLWSILGFIRVFEVYLEVAENHRSILLVQLCVYHAI